jgi:hypothetical protein
VNDFEQKDVSVGSEIGIFPGGLLTEALTNMADQFEQSLVRGFAVIDQVNSNLPKSG